MTSTVILISVLIAVIGLSRVLYPSSLAGLRQAVFEHLAVITRCGLPIGPGLRALADERLEGRRGLRRRRDAELIRGLASRHEATGTLTAAFEGAKRGMIPAGQLDLLRAAEARGALPLALEVICDEEAGSSDARWKLVEWLAYPTVLATFVLPVSAFQSMVILPKFAEVRVSMGVSPSAPWLPFAAELAITAFFLIAFAVLLLRRGLPAPLVRVMSRARDALFPSNPFFRSRQSRWLKRVAALLRSGATLPEALEGTSGLRDVGGKSIRRAAQLAREGQALEPVLTTAFGVDAGRMLAPALLSAERHGSLGEGLDALGRREEVRASRKLASLAEMLKPAPVVLLALIAGSQVFDVFSTIVTINGALVNPW